MRDVILVVLLLLIQLFCGSVFVGGTVMSVLGIDHSPISWELHEIVEIGAALGLVFGAVLGVIVLRRSIVRQKRAEEQLRQVSGAFMELMHERFHDWGLTTAERDVALFAIKGMSTHEIAVLRGTAEGTVKAQTNAIYRKSGVNGRPQLLSLFIEDLMDDAATPAPVVANAIEKTEPLVAVA